MTTTLAAHLSDLAEALHDLRRRFRQAARVEVARAVAEALREVTRAMICGPGRFPAAAGPGNPAWDDPWADGPAEMWQPHHSYREEVERDVADRAHPAALPPALVVGLAAARWAYVRTGQVGPAVLVGLLVVLAGYAGGPTVQALLEAWSAAADLLSHPGRDRRP